ncbi:MAG: phosphoribosylformylglycinamidine synthase subunit PurQ [Thermoplasmata archaeon]|nr:phosphoribosylformylglycinamidine synthase subunit PurQ [Thermoplasmata archaeon]
MQRKEIKIAVLQMEGTNCEYESYLAFKELGTSPEYVHIKELEKGKKKIDDYHCIFLPGGFSAGDYIRAGAIFAARLKANLLRELKKFVENGYVMAGICNGFQILIEMGFLPALNGISDEPEACLATNDSCRFECRPTLIRHEKSECKITRNIPYGKISMIPVAHAEGKIVFKDEEYAEEVNEKQVVFRYVDDKGNLAGYPWNPNGSYGNIAGICNDEGNILGMMPHPERAFHEWQQPDWKSNDGKEIFEGIVKYIEEKW